jgi:quinohemoprotein ethanol dehydrogenase
MKWLTGNILAVLLSAVSAVGLCASPQARGSGLDSQLRDNSGGSEWAGPGRTYGEQHYSPLTAINAKTIGSLGLVWSLDLPPGNSVSQPIEAGNNLYFVSGQAIVHAVDAASGRELWQYDPKVAELAGHKLRWAWGTRGLAWWNGKVYVGTLDGRLIALDARTGAPVWTRMTVKPGDTNYITGAPRVFDGKIIVGFGGADVGPARGYVSTYDAETGRLLWRWYIVPGNPADGFENSAMKMAAKTWSGHWWKYGGGGTVWNAMSYDPELKTVYIGTGNGSPWNHKARSEGKGDNLFLASIVALDSATGAYKWHYQVNPGESWDFTATNDMAFADLVIRGTRHKVLMTAPKNGFFYVMDRRTGKLLSAEPIAKVNWASKIDLRSGRPVENPQARYPNGTTAIVWPSDRGAHNWLPMAFSPKTEYAYIPVVEKAASWQDFGVANEEWMKFMPVGTTQAAVFYDLFPKVSDPIDNTSKLVAWDARAQKAVWSAPTPGPLGGGVMATAGNLVFGGQLDGKFNAYAADNGQILWSFQANAPVIAPPISYSVDGRQYVTVLTGSGTGASFLGESLTPFSIDYRTQARRVLTFALGGTASLPAPSPLHLRPVEDPGYKADAAKEKQGYFVFATNCLLCHGFDAVAAGAAPDLRASTVVLAADAFANVVKNGALLTAGMPRYAEFDDDTLSNLRQYIRWRAQVWRSATAAAGSSSRESDKPVK